MDDTDIPDYRRAVRGHLAERPSVAQSSATIHRHVAREFGASPKDTENAIAVLEAMKQLKSSPDPMGGAVRYYQATADGILAHERGE